MSVWKYVNLMFEEDFKQRFRKSYILRQVISDTVVVIMLLCYGFIYYRMNALQYYGDYLYRSGWLQNESICYEVHGETYYVPTYQYAYDLTRNTDGEVNLLLNMDTYEIVEIVPTEVWNKYYVRYKVISILPSVISTVMYIMLMLNLHKLFPTASAVIAWYNYETKCAELCDYCGNTCRLTGSCVSEALKEERSKL